MQQPGLEPGNKNYSRTDSDRDDHDSGNQSQSNNATAVHRLTFNRREVDPVPSSQYHHDVLEVRMKN